MTSEELYIVLGKVSFHFTKIDFLCCNIAVELGMYQTPYELFALQSVADKITRVKKYVETNLSREERKKLIRWLSRFDDLRKERNRVEHSIILSDSQSPATYMVFGYQLKNNKIEKTTQHVTEEWFSNLELELRTVNNQGYELLIELGRRSKDLKKRAIVLRGGK